MKSKILFVCLFTHAVLGLANDSLNVNNTTLNTPYPNKFTGVSSMAINEQLNYSFDSVNNIPITLLRDTVFSILKPLHIKLLRFPGGTIGNFYHFYKKGYGIDTSETNCASGRLGFEYANQFLSVDEKADKNIIEYFKAEVDTLKKNGDSIGVAFRINSHTHFYKGDLIKYSDSLQYLIDLYMDHDSGFLNSIGNSMDSAKINSIASRLVQLQSNEVIKRIKTQLINDSGFSYRFKENMDALGYLKSNRVNVVGIEIGNETDAEYIIYDDDLSYFRYDCTNKPDSLNVNIFTLPMKAYLEGLVKNWLVVSLYADSIKIKYNIPVGIPGAVRFNYLKVNNNYQPELAKPYELTAKRRDLWNKYYGLQTNIYALIPHFYGQGFMDCSAYTHSDTFGLDRFTVNKIAERFFKAYIDSVITFNIQNINFYGSNKPLWVTEWNFTDGSFATNTFLHTIYNYYFIRKMLAIHEFSPNLVQAWIYHMLIGGYYSWPLIRSSYDGQNQFHAEAQITYPAFYIWSNTLNQQVKKIKTPFWQENESSIVDAFINAAKDEIYIQYINSDSAKHYLQLNNLKIINGTQELDIKKIDRYMLDAVSFTSTNFTYCNAESDSNDYEIIEDTISGFDSLLLPSLSMGKFTLHLKNKFPTTIFKQQTSVSKIFPNPATNTLTIILNEFNNYAHYSYLIYNSMGELLLQENLLNKDNIINTSALSAGFYIIQLQINNQLIVIKRLL